MILLLILPIILAQLFTLSLTDLLTPLSNPSHEFCLQNLPHSSWRELYSSLLCGSPLEDSDLSNLFRATGLFHLIVVSGAHLTFLESILNLLPQKYRLPQFLIFLCLFIYSLACQLNPPVLRGLVAWCLRKFNRKLHCHYSDVDQTLLSGLLCFCLFPQWIGSWSFLLSWLAALAVHWPLAEDNTLKRAVLVYIFLFPVLAQWGSNSPLHILCNILFTPVFSILMFPLSLITTLFHFLTPLTDFIWTVYLELLKLFQTPISQAKAFTNQIFPLWIYLFALQSLAHLYSIFKKRGLS